MRGITAQLSPTPPPTRSAVGDVLGNHRSVCACLSAPVSIFDNEGSQTLSHSASVRACLMQGSRTKSVAMVSTHHGLPLSRPIARNFVSRSPYVRLPPGKCCRGSVVFVSRRGVRAIFGTDDLGAVSNAGAPMTRRCGPTSFRSNGAGEGRNTTLRPLKSTSALGYTAETNCMVSRTVCRKRLLSASLPKCLAS